MRLEGQMEKTEEKKSLTFFFLSISVKNLLFLFLITKRNTFFFPIVFSQSALENVVKVVSGGNKSLMSIFSIT